MIAIEMGNRKMSPNVPKKVAMERGTKLINEIKKAINKRDADIKMMPLTKHGVHIWIVRRPAYRNRSVDV